VSLTRRFLPSDNTCILVPSLMRLKAQYILSPVEGSWGSLEKKREGEMGGGERGGGLLCWLNIPFSSLPGRYSENLRVSFVRQHGIGKGKKEKRGKRKGGGGGKEEKKKKGGGGGDYSYSRGSIFLYVVC